MVQWCRYELGCRVHVAIYIYRAGRECIVKLVKRAIFSVEAPILEAHDHDQNAQQFVSYVAVQRRESEV